jgi:hypothetical protein
VTAAGSGSRPNARNEVREPVRVRGAVVVGERQDPAGGRRQSQVARGRQAEPGLRQVPHARETGGQNHPRRRLGGALVDDEDLAGQHGSLGERRQTTPQRIGPTARSHRHRDL